MKKVRADILAVTRGLCETRSQAQRLIMAGQLRRGPDSPVKKPGELLEPDDELQLVSHSSYVSRGADKILVALQHHQPSLAGRVGMDIGASTGGFTELLLQYQVAKVYAVDVGYGQLHWRLRQDPRVICLERVNARYLDSKLIPEKIEVVTADVSFISLTKILPAVALLVAPDAWIFLLVKPQFEAGRNEVAKGGVVRDPVVKARCVKEIAEFAVNNYGWLNAGAMPAALTGPKGNQEYILTLRVPGPALV